MRVLGLDPSFTAFGWALHDTSAPFGSPSRCLGRGRFATDSKMEFIERYRTQRERLANLIREEKPDRVGIEFPVFSQLYSEGMYGLFLFCCEALKTEGCDVVFWSPLQIKAHARDSTDLPANWQMDKMDMVKAAKTDTGGGRWNHNEADAYLCAVLAGRFWQFYTGEVSEENLTRTEHRYFTRVHTFTRGKRAGKTVRTGVIHREDDRFFLWSKVKEP